MSFFNNGNAYKLELVSEEPAYENQQQSGMNLSELVSAFPSDSKSGKKDPPKSINQKVKLLN